MPDSSDASDIHTKRFFVLLTPDSALWRRFEFFEKRNQGNQIGSDLSGADMDEFD